MLPLFCVLAFAVVALIALPSTASAFNIANFNYNNSTLQAAGHPNVTISFDRKGGENEDLRDVLLDLPTGVFANPESANPKCTATQFNTDKCPANSVVGSTIVKVKAGGLLDITAPGTINVITPDANQVATLGITVRPPRICILLIFCAVPDKMFLKTGIVVRSYEDSGLRTYTPGAGRTTSIAIPPIVKSGLLTLDITVNSMSLTFNGKANSAKTGPYFWTQTGSCLPATAAVTITSYQNVNSSATSSYTPTGCPSVPFNPTFTWSVTNNTSEAQTAAKFTLNVPEADATIQNTLPKIVDVDFPNGSGINLNALSGVTACTEDQLKTRACPASSIIGTANALSKYLPPSLDGKVFAMGVGNQIPVGVELVGPRNTIVIFRGTLGTRGDANLGTGHVYATFDRIPQLPFASFTLDFTKELYKNPQTCGTQTVNAKMTGFNGTAATNGNGTVVNKTATYSVANCAVAPETTITAGPPSTTSINTPSFSFTSNIAAATFQCKMDAGVYELCTSPYNSPALTDGSHTFTVKAVNGLVEDPTPASATFTVATSGFEFFPAPVITPSTTQGAAHPNLDATINLRNGQPKSVAIKLPAGFSASLTARPLCGQSDANAGTCPAASKIGSSQITVDTFGGAVTGVGEAFLTDAPTANDAGGIAVKIPLSIGDFIASGGANLVNNGNNQNLELRNIPTDVNGTAITVTQFKLGLDGATNNFLTNPSNCSATDGFVANSVAHDNTNADPITVAFQATGCSTIPFAPTVTQTLISPVAGTETGIIADVTLQPGNATIKTLRVNEPPSLGPNFPSFGVTADQCPSASAASPTSVFNPAGCPPQSLVGSMVINTPLLPTPLTGQVFLINKSPLPWFGVKFDQPGISVRLIGVTSTPQVVPTCDPLTDDNGFCQTQISAVFNNLPDVPLSSVKFTLDGPTRAGVNQPLSGKILVVAVPGDATCVPSSPAKSIVTPFSGNPATNLTQNIAISGC
jgi:hypothetical protein